MFAVTFILIEASIWCTIHAARPSGKQLLTVLKKYVFSWRRYHNEWEFLMLVIVFVVIALLHALNVIF